MNVNPDAATFVTGILCLALGAIGALVLTQPGLRAERERANTARADHQEMCADLLEAREDLEEARRERDAARLTVAALADELTRERRAAMILRTGLLDAQREVDELRAVAS